MPKKSPQDLAAQLKARQEPPAKPKPPPRRRAPKAGSMGGTTTVYTFPHAGTLLRKTAYFSPEEWAAIQTARKATGDPATAIIRRAVRNELGLD